MSRLLAVVACLCALPPHAAPAPKLKAAETYYFTTRVGDKLEYELRSRKGATPWRTEVVTKVEPVGDGVRVTLACTFPDGQTAESVVAAGPDGLSWLVAYGAKGDAPVPFLKLPAKAGTTWELVDGKHRMVCTVAEVDEEVPPAGKYKCIRVEVALSGADVPPNINWYARGVGLVKVEMAPGTVAVLKAFTPAK